MTIDMIGWVATTIFVSSYLFKDPMALRRIQALAAALWVAYGVIIHATPVVVANLMVAGIAMYSSLAAGRKLVVSPRRIPQGDPEDGPHLPGARHSEAMQASRETSRSERTSRERPSRSQYTI